jgi:hypothetical protein
MGSAGTGFGQLACSYKNGNEYSISVRGEKFLSS